MTSELTTERREKLVASLAEKEAVVLFAACEANLEKFKQDNNFLYVTGLSIPEAIYFLDKGGPVPTEYLFIQRNDPKREVWDGRKMSTDEAKELSGIERVGYLDEFPAVISMYCPFINKIWSNIGTQSVDRPLTMQLFRLAPIRERFPNISIESITSLITPLRKIKSNWEIMQLQRAIDITGKAIMDVLENAESSMMEFELEAMMFYRMQRMGVKQWGFSPIVGTGLNAATLHYKTNECRIENGEVVLMDVGASYLNYSADISRCFPIGGSFSERQKQIYSLVLDVQKKIIEMIKPGAEHSELNRTARDLLAQGMVDIGLIEHTDDVAKYYMHGVSHFLGMDTHDVGERTAILEVGNVITVEPGIYIPEEKLGIRIEDDVLVTETGYCVLSQNIPKEIAELEEIRKAALARK